MKKVVDCLKDKINYIDKKRVLLKSKIFKSLKKIKGKVCSEKSVKLYKKIFLCLVRIFLIFISFVALDQGFNSLVGNKLNMGFISDDFSLMYIGIITVFISCLPRVIQLVVYSFSYIVLFFVVIAQYFYFSILNNFLSLSDLSNAGEGMDYFSMILDYININLIYNVLLFVFMFFITIKFLKEKDRLFKNIFIKIIFIILGVNCSIYIYNTNHSDIVSLLGDSIETNDYKVVDNPKNVYDQFVDKTKSMEISGFYEYIVRDAYFYYVNNYNKDLVAERKDVDSYFLENKHKNEDNDYSEILEGKNVIFLLMETMDTWLVNDINTPTMMSMANKGIKFVNHYAQPFGGGSTFNSEHAINTGFYIPNNGYSIYNSSNNNYPESLPKLFKDKGYITTSVHGNTKEFYNRGDFHKMYGYQTSIFSEEIGYTFFDDGKLVNDDIYKYVVPSLEKPFMTFITTLSGHSPFGDSNELDNMIKEINKKAVITDNFVKELRNRLDEDGILEDTVIVMFGDHYAYTFLDQEYVKEVKEISSDNEIHRVPFIIWADELEDKVIDSYTDHQDMIPIISNLFDLDYDRNKFIGTDVFSENHRDYVYFRDFSYLGNKNDDNVISKMISINDKIIMNNYFNYID